MCGRGAAQRVATGASGAAARYARLGESATGQPQSTWLTYPYP